jgi:D-glycero-D-manno-heptose 1,7-bisphosphate phosphatase
VGIGANERLPVAVLFDRDGTLIRDVPYNGDPSRVQPVPGAKDVLDELRAKQVRIGVVSNQSGVGRGLVSREEVRRVNERVSELLGPFGTWQICPHAPEQACACRKPMPALVLAACEALGVPASRTAMIGDIEADVHAGEAAGCRTVLVPNEATASDEVDRAPVKAADLRSAVALVLPLLEAR